LSQALLAAVERLAEQMRREQEVVLDRLDLGFRDLLGEVTGNRAGPGRRPEGRPT
jgi:hypothetical protein